MGNKRTNDVSVPLTGQEIQVGQTRMGAMGKSRFGARKKGKSEFEVLQGTQYSHNGRMALKVQIVDRPNDRYIEVVIDEESRKVLRYCNEPLSAHFGHGSDKPGLRTARAKQLG